jgi:uncharacterized membrane protein (TIGR02234 family)
VIEGVQRVEGAAVTAGRDRLLSRPAAFGCLLLGGLLGVVATAQPWWRAAGDGAEVAFPGTESTGGLSQALAVVTLAGVLLMLVLKVRGRRVLAVLLGVVALGQVLVGALRLRPAPDAVRTKIREVSLVDQYALSPTPWPWVYALAGAVVLCGAVVLLLGAGSWAASASRFERTAPGPVDPASDDPSVIWKALDAGVDPTTSPNDPPAPVGPDPDVRFGGAGDTMGANTGRIDPLPSAPHQSGQDSGQNRSQHNQSDSSRPTGRSSQSPK